MPDDIFSRPEPSVPQELIGVSTDAEISFEVDEIEKADNPKMYVVSSDLQGFALIMRKDQQVWLRNLKDGGVVTVSDKAFEVLFTEYGNMRRVETPDAEPEKRPHLPKFTLFNPTFTEE